jgi:hypothetical protein
MGVGGQRHAPSTLPRSMIWYLPYMGQDGAPEPVWTGAENLALTGIRPPDRLASREWLYRLRYPDPQTVMGTFLGDF